jgi:hypothetical protein
LTLDGENWVLPGTINQFTVKDGINVCEITSTTALIKAKVNTVGALYLIFML